MIVVSLLTVMGGTFATAGRVASAASAGQRVDLKVLVISDGNPTEEAIVAELASESIPYTRVDLTSASRPTIDAAFLSGTAATGPEAFYQAVVLPNDAPVQLTADEKAALVTFETTFGIRQVDSFNWPGATTGLNTVTGSGPTGGYAGSLDGAVADVTSAGKLGPFSYLAGPVPFEDNDPAVSESFGYVAVPLENAATQTFTTLVDAPIPGSTQRGSILGVVTNGTREELVSTVAVNQYQSQFQLLAHGIITWMTRGVHLGYDRNYFTVQVDDLFLPDSRWSTTANCTPGDDCPAGSPVTTPDIRMTPADVTTAVQWSQQMGFRLDFAFNGGGSDEWAASHGGVDPLKPAILANKSSFNFINHTFTHEFLGCIQDFTVLPWQCTTVNGVTQWMSQAGIQSQITDNVNWANANGLPFNASELVTGEHSGLATLPQQPTDNPNLAPALTATGIAVTASDNSRESQSRQIGSATTVPRYPMSVFYNTATKAEAADEYNWIYGSTADGGSGYCTLHPDTTTCIAPLDLATGYENYIVPTETRIDMGHIMGNDPRPHYAHVSNLAEEQILYSPLNSIITKYRSVFAPDTPIVQPTYSQDAQILSQQTAFAATLANTGGTGAVAAGLSAYVLDGNVTVETTTGMQVPLTAPIGSRLGNPTGPDFGNRYEGEQSAWTTVGSTTPLVVALPAGWTTPPTTTTAPPTTTTEPPTTTTAPPTTTT
ncbi:MAG: hypothetical protein JWL73_2443, partial [Actinomycetia bacterium]|nr:hypothetical protein [Actinomycetes bacterium]